MIRAFVPLVRRWAGGTGTAHTVVDDTSFMTAKNASIVTEETMSINGDEIHLG